MQFSRSYLKQRAQFIQRTLGTKSGAGFLRRRGVSVEGAVAALARKSEQPK